MAKSVFDALTDSDVDELLAKLEAQQKLKRLQEEGGDTGDTGDVSEEEAAAAEKAALAAEAKAKAEAEAKAKAEAEAEAVAKAEAEAKAKADAAAAAKAEEEAKAAALAAVQQAPSKSLTGDNIFSPITVKAVQTATETGKGSDSADITEVGKIPVITDPAIIGADGGLFSGGLGKPTVLPPVVVTGTKPAGGMVFDPNALNLAGTGQGVVGEGQLGGGAGAATSSTGFKGAPTMPEDTPFGKIYNEELTRRNAVRVANGQQPISASDVTEITQLADWAVKEQDKLFGEQDSDAQRQARAKAAVAAKQTGIPLVVPIPGLDPTTALILTAAGFILSGGNVATFDPNNPVQSVIDAGKGTVATVQKAGEVLTGQTDILGGQTGAGTTGGGASTSGTTVGAGQTPSISTPVVVGAGILSGAIGGTGPFVGPVAAQQQPTGTVGVTTGALGGTTGQAATGTGKPGGDVPATGGPGAIVGTPSSIGSGQKGGDVSIIDQQVPVVTGGYKDVPETKQPTTTTTTTTGGGTGPIGGGTGGPTGGGGGEQPPQTKTPVITTGPGGGTGGPSGGPTASTTIFTPMPAFTFTKTTPGEVAMRDFEKEFGLTSSTLMGQPGKDLANFYQQLQSQFTPSTLTQLAGTSQQQLMSDLDRLAMAQRGQLSPEDVRSAQQSAREAYAARGQVMAPGAIGAEILNRDVLRRQREAEARANVQQSMANLGAAAQLQTGNIFAPFANLLAKTYGPTSEYANAVYDYNVNAYNAYQAAQENLAAYKEAAAKGEQAQFINTFANFLANNGIQTTQNALAKFFQALLPKG